MPEYLAPGVYVEEIPNGPRTIEGVPTSTAAFVGETQRGPLTPQRIGSVREFRERFGGRWRDDAFLPEAVDGFFANGGAQLVVCRVAGAQSATASRTLGGLTVRAVGPGAWGHRVWVRIGPASRMPAVGDAPAFRLDVAYWSERPPSFEPFDPFDDANAAVLPRPERMERHDDLSPAAHGRVGATSRLVVLVATDDTAAVPPTDDGGWLEGGADDPLGVRATDFLGEPTERRGEPQGLAALRDDAWRDVALVHAPWPATDADEVARAVIAHAEAMRFRFAIVDAPPRLAADPAADPRRAIADSRQAALYAPWLCLAEPVAAGGIGRTVPPGGYVAGVMARVDRERGVQRAPAQEAMYGVAGLEQAFDPAAQERLNLLGVNLLRRLPDGSIRIWGARTLSSDPAWRYVPLRRLLIYLEHSIESGLPWAVFEPNDETLWKRVRAAVGLFLRAEWRSGALVGSTEREAFFVACDRSTMTQDDLANGRLVCEVGVAPLRPAEFLILRIGQWTADRRP